MKHLVLAALAFAALSLGACQSTSADNADTAGMQAVNAVCPMMPSHEIDPTVTTEWNGETIAFCCNGCVGKWDALSDADKQAKLDAAMK